jgi:N-acetylmuramoyl-L-alanine amidase
MRRIGLHIISLEKTQKYLVKLGLLTFLTFSAFLLFKVNDMVSAEIMEDAAESKIILIDPGHGGVDGGASGKNSGVLEKDINLSICKKIEQVLKKDGYKVIMSREDDRGLYTEDGRIRKKKLEDLANRCNLIKDSNCDMFISIHLNAFPQTQYYGAQVWYAGNDASIRFANILQMNLREDLDKTNDRKIKPGGSIYRILKSVGEKPAVISECGFLSNSAEEIKLKDEGYQQQIAESVVKSVNMYFKQIKN